MDLETLAQTVAEKLRKEMGEGYLISVATNLKNNNTEQIGITFTHEQKSVSPTIYINDLLEQIIRNERETGEVVREVLSRYENSIAATEEIKLLDIELPSCRNRVIYRLISREQNKKMLEDFPYIPFLDMAITFHIIVGANPTYVQTIKIDKKLQEKWDVSVEQLFKMANDNTEKIFPLEIGDLNQIAKKQHIQTEENDQTDMEGLAMIVITNTTGLFGASAVLYKEVMQNIADEIACDLYVIPSSVHEMILVPAEDEKLYGVLCGLIKKVNENFVSQDEILSDRVYIYLRKDKKFISK